MKRKWTGIRVVITLCAALGWWGGLYPELTMTPDTYAVIGEDGFLQGEEEMAEWDSGGDVYRSVLEAGGSRIRFKSRFLMQIEALMRQWK